VLKIRETADARKRKQARIQRYYLPAYIASSWHKNELEARTEIRWVLKLAPRKSDSKGKRERGAKAESKLELAFATERDVSAKSAIAMVWAGDARPFSLSADAAREGWTGLEWSYPQQVESTKLASMLRDEYFDGRAWESFFAKPALSLASLFLLFLMARAGVQGWRERRLWGRPLHRRELLWRWMFEPPARQIASPERWLELERPAPLTLAAPLESPPAPLPAGVWQVAIPSASEPPPRQPKVVQSVPVVLRRRSRRTPGTSPPGSISHADDVLKSAFSRPGADVPRAGVCFGAAELLEPRPAGFQRVAKAGWRSSGVWRVRSAMTILRG